MNVKIATQASVGRNLCVDGHEFASSESNWAGDGQYPPFAVFDIDAQVNLLPYYATRGQAEMAMQALLMSKPATISFIDAAGEVVVKLADGWTVRSGVYNKDAEDALTSGEYVRLCKPNGDEYAYWDQSEWRDDPALVMGAIINSAAGLRIEERTDSSQPTGQCSPAELSSSRGLPVPNAAPPMPEVKLPKAASCGVRPVSIQAGLATSEGGDTVDLLKIQALCNAHVQESGDLEFMKATDELSKLTGLWQGPHGEWFDNADELAEVVINLQRVPSMPPK